MPQPPQRWVPSAQACGFRISGPRKRGDLLTVTQQAGGMTGVLVRPPGPAQRLSPKKIRAWKGVSRLGLSECTEDPPGGHHLLSFGLSQAWALGWRSGLGMEK